MNAFENENWNSNIIHTAILMAHCEYATLQVIVYLPPDPLIVTLLELSRVNSWAESEVFSHVTERLRLNVAEFLTTVTS